MNAPHVTAATRARGSREGLQQGITDEATTAFYRQTGDNFHHRRCVVCGDPSGPTSHCRKCRAWANLAVALHSLPGGLDHRRLRSARAYFDEQHRIPDRRRLDLIEARLAALEGTA